MSGDVWYHYSSELQWVVFFAIAKHIKMNKLLAISCMAVAAMAAPEAEADPYLLYGGYGGYGLGAYDYAHAAPVVASGYASVSPSASVSIAGLAGAAVPAVAGGYAAAGRYVANSAGVVHVAKREAEAEADAEADPYYAYGYHGLGYAGYHGLGYAGYAGYTGYPYAYNYGLGYSHYPHAVAAPAVVAAAPAVAEVKAAAAPLVHAPVVAGGYADVSPSNAVNIAGLAPAAIPAVGGAYAGAGRYCANSAGVIHCA